MRALRLIRLGSLCCAVVMTCLLTAASAQAIHPRPKSASPVFMSLVPAYNQCAALNRTHGPPLAFASCNPPTQTSAQATVGTPDAFGGAPNATGYFRFKFLPCGPGHCPPQTQDIGFHATLTDVRCTPAGARCGTANASGPADYVGELGLSLKVRLTDHWNATAPGGGTDAATVNDFTLELPVESGFTPNWTCTQSASTSTGSACDLRTTLMANLPGSVDGRRAIWDLEDVRIYDGGADGDAHTTADNTVFARPGIFVP